MKQSLNNNNKMMSLSCFLLMSFSIFRKKLKQLANIENRFSIQRRSVLFWVYLQYFTRKPSGLSQKNFPLVSRQDFLGTCLLMMTEPLIASGIGFSYNNYNENLFYNYSGTETVYSIIDSKTVYNKNKFKQYCWSTYLSNSDGEHQHMKVMFWRLYGGFKFSYLLYSKSGFTDADSKINSFVNNKDFKKSSNDFIFQRVIIQ
jgi:hypothetical protein